MRSIVACVLIASSRYTWSSLCSLLRSSQAWEADQPRCAVRASLPGAQSCELRSAPSDDPCLYGQLPGCIHLVRTAATAEQSERGLVFDHVQGAARSSGGGGGGGDSFHLGRIRDCSGAASTVAGFEREKCSGPAAGPPPPRPVAARRPSPAAESRSLQPAAFTVSMPGDAGLPSLSTALAAVTDGEAHAVAAHPDPPFGSTASSSRTETPANPERELERTPCKDRAIPELSEPVSGLASPVMRETTPAAIVAVPGTGDRSHISPGPASAEGPNDKDERLRLEVLLLSGSRTRLPCRPTDRVGDVKRRIWKDWPAGTHLRFSCLG